MASSRGKSVQAPQHLILDSGAVIALARGDQRARAFLARALELGVPVEIPVVVIAETIRNGPRDAPVNRVVKAVGSVSEAREVHGRTAGRLLGAARSSGPWTPSSWPMPLCREEPISSPGTARISNASRHRTPKSGSSPLGTSGLAGRIIKTKQEGRRDASAPRGAPSARCGGKLGSLGSGGP